MLIVVDRPCNLLTIVFCRKGIPGLFFSVLTVVYYAAGKVSIICQTIDALPSRRGGKSVGICPEAPSVSVSTLGRVNRRWRKWHQGM